MRTIVTIYTVIWITLGVLFFPILLFIGGFLSFDAPDTRRILVICVLLFYLQLMIQSVVARVFLKRIYSLEQYLFAILIIILSPILLTVGIPVGVHYASNLILQITIFEMITLQLIGSIWVWKIIATKDKKPSITTQATDK